MKKIIGEMAGRVWNILGKKGRVDMFKLPQIMKEKRILYAWLWVGWPEKINLIFIKRKGEFLYH